MFDESEMVLGEILKLECKWRKGAGSGLAKCEQRRLFQEDGEAGRSVSKKTKATDH